MKNKQLKKEMISRGLKSKKRLKKKGIKIVSADHKKLYDKTGLPK